MSPKKNLWVAFDVETARLHYEVAGGWDNPAGFGLTVGSAQDNTGAVVVHRADKGGEAAAREALVEHLLKYDRIVSFNGLRFDNGVLANGDDIIQGQLDEKTWDIKALLERIIGVDERKGPHVISLDGVASATIGAGKTLEDGRMAVRLWRKGQYEEVVKYNLNDTRITAEVWEFALRNGYVLFEPSRVPIYMTGAIGDTSSWAPSPGLARLVVKVKVDWKR
jgi:uncharacterized protein YprB with RNaseH-like and TPR domain